MDDYMSTKSSESHKSSVGTNPRRIAADQSVSLRHPPAFPKQQHVPSSRELDHNVSSGSSRQVDTASEALKPIWTKDSSGESSNAEKWFEKSNNNVKKNRTSTNDDEPPFFLRNSSSEKTNPMLPRQRIEDSAAINIIENANVFGDESNGSEDFRSVIDDLTIENQQLKRRLRRFERMHNTRLDPEALFEVRVHGLPPPKKRELEEMLRNFVTKMGQPGQSGATHISNRVSAPDTLLRYHTSSTTSRVGDSGYHSLSISGQNSSSHTGQMDKKAQATSTTNNNFDNDIHNYLWEIPAGLQPQHNGPVSEKEKKKIIVRRLEQLFAGRDPSAGGHQQPIQQQKLAQSAARAERRATQASGDALAQEGSRVARIMPKNKTVLIPQALQPTHKADTDLKHDLGASTDAHGDDVVEQRPTRPLDLDPYRAQVPEENMEYIRHLGFSPPHFDVEAQKDGHGWIYLNVLHNMAQLHLSNVTVDFVRKSITEYSKKLEISPDGRKLRWIGSKHVTNTSSNNSPEQLDNPASWKQSAVHAESRSYNGSSMSGILGGQKVKSKLAYSPLFRRDESTSEDSAIQDMSNMLLGSNTKGNSPNTNNRMSQAADNPMIFYTNADFYTDLSGDPAALKHQRLGNHKPALGKPIGTQSSPEQLSSIYGLDSDKGPLSRLILASPKASKTSLSSSSVKLIDHSSQSSSSSREPEAVDFEVSGLGGVYPADNFAINVKSRQKQKAPTSEAGFLEALRRKAYPTQIRRMLQQTPSENLSSSAEAPRTKAKVQGPVVQREIISSKQKELPASQLPEGNYFHDSTDSESEDELLDYASDEATTFGRHGQGYPIQRTDWANPAYMQQKSSDSSSGVRTDEDDYSHISDDANDRSEESMDLLATVRAADPESIRVREREFDSIVAERLAEEIPAGSSAATAEGGSGFNSPNLPKDGVMHLSLAGTLGSAAIPRPVMGPPQQLRSANLKRHRSSGDSATSKVRVIKSPRLDESD